MAAAKTVPNVAKKKTNENPKSFKRRSTMPKKLHKAIEKKLDQLHELLDSLEEARNLDSNDPDT
jgi:hypothetical protein